MNIKQLIEQRVRIELMSEGFFSNLFSKISKDIQNNRVKIAQKAISKEHPELANAVEELKTAMENTKKTFNKIIEKDPESIKHYQAILDNIRNE